MTIEEWLTYAAPESLSLYMFQSPRKAKRLHFDVIPKNVDDYLTFLNKFPSQTPEEKLTNPVWHIHGGKPPAGDLPVSFALLLNLVSVSNADNKNVLWGFIKNYAPEASPEELPMLDAMADYAVAYYHDFVKPAKSYRNPDETEKQAMISLRNKLNNLSDDLDAEEIQTEVYAIGKTYFDDNLRNWFKALYEVLLGQSQGPRFGSFIAVYGLERTVELINQALNGDLTAD